MNMLIALFFSWLSAAAPMNGVLVKYDFRNGLAKPAAHCGLLEFIAVGDEPAKRCCLSNLPDPCFDYYRAVCFYAGGAGGLHIRVVSPPWRNGENGSIYLYADVMTNRPEAVVFSISDGRKTVSASVSAAYDWERLCVRLDCSPDSGNLVFLLGLAPGCAGAWLAIDGMTLSTEPPDPDAPEPFYDIVLAEEVETVNEEMLRTSIARIERIATDHPELCVTYDLESLSFNLHGWDFARNSMVRHIGGREYPGIVQYSSRGLKEYYTMMAKYDKYDGGGASPSVDDRPVAP